MRIAAALMTAGLAGLLLGCQATPPVAVAPPQPVLPPAPETHRLTLRMVTFA
jgi:hypothetical protein